jgi:hypothetical protein
VIFGVKLDAEIIAPERFRGHKRGAGTGEGIEHDLAGLGERLNQRRENREGLFRSLIAVFKST